METDRSVKVIWFNLITLTNGTWNQKLSVYIAHANKSKMPKSTPAHFLFPNKPLYVGLGLGKRKLAKFRNMLVLIIMLIIVVHAELCIAVHIVVEIVYMVLVMVVKW